MSSCQAQMPKKIRVQIHQSVPKAQKLSPWNADQMIGVTQRYTIGVREASAHTAHTKGAQYSSKMLNGEQGNDNVSLGMEEDGGERGQPRRVLAIPPTNL